MTYKITVSDIEDRLMRNLQSQGISYDRAKEVVFYMGINKLVEKGHKVEDLWEDFDRLLEVAEEKAY